MPLGAAPQGAGRPSVARTVRSSSRMLLVRYYQPSHHWRAVLRQLGHACGLGTLQPSSSNLCPPTSGSASSVSPMDQSPDRSSTTRIGLNGPSPCNSGKKYK